MSAAFPADHNRSASDTRCSVTLRVSNRTLVTLQLLAIDIRFRSGVILSRSAILRGFIRWMEECDIDTRQVLSSDDLRTSLLMALPCKRES